MDEVEAGKYIQAHWHIPVAYMTAYPDEGAWNTRHPTSVWWGDELFGYRLGHPEADLSSDERDGTAYGPLGVVIDPAFTWEDDRPPRTPWHKTIIYEVHVKKGAPVTPGSAREAPLLLAGDEMMRTQRGNNNVYCQDNKLSWRHWPLPDEQKAFCDFVRTLLQIRRTQPVFRRRKFFLGRAIYMAKRSEDVRARLNRPLGATGGVAGVSDALEPTQRTASSARRRWGGA